MGIIVKDYNKGLGRIIFDEKLKKNVFSITKEDLKERQKDFIKYYNKHDTFYYNHNLLYKNDEFILMYNDGIPYKWISQDNVYKK